MYLMSNKLSENLYKYHGVNEGTCIGIKYHRLKDIHMIYTNMGAVF